MGLSAPKNRSRIANDPQNTTWAHNTTRFGHKLLTQQGWTPGSSLGAKDAAHAAHYTAASTSHIRVLLKDDTLGLGAKRGSERAENFGLAGLESVLGRLNGKSEEVEKKQAERRKAMKMMEVGNRWGGMRFVSGGFLVGERIEKRKEVVEEVEREREQRVREVEGKAKGEKRKRGGGDEGGERDDEQPKLKRKKKSLDLKQDALEQSEESGSSKSKSKSKSKKDKKEKKEKKEKKKSKKSSSPSPSTSTSSSDEKSTRKSEKKRQKEEKRLAKALRKAAKQSTSSAPTPTTSTPTTETSTPIAGLTFGAGGRHAVRARFIRQKKMASMDPRALKEIFMIKTPS